MLAEQRLMEVLTREEFKNWCLAIDKQSEKGNRIEELQTKKTACGILMASFAWSNTEQRHDYWHKIYVRLGSMM